MRLSGVDPGIIRELSGIYKPFVKAFKELLSNSFDADAKGITVRVKEVDGEKRIYFDTTGPADTPPATPELVSAGTESKN